MIKFKWDHPRGTKERKIGIIDDIRPLFRFISEMLQDMDIISVEAERHDIQ